MNEKTEPRKLPDGGVTESVDEYLKAWKSLVADVEKLLGCRVVGFDPDFSIVIDRQSLSLPVSAAMAISRASAALTEAYDALKANQVFHTPLAKGLRRGRQWNEYEADAVDRTRRALGNPLA